MGEYLIIAVVLGVLIPLYFLPMIVAVRRRHHAKVGIITLNVLLGWTFWGWVIALVWVYVSPATRMQHVVVYKADEASGRDLAGGAASVRSMLDAGA